MLDWRALRPSSNHFPYTISKVGLAGLTRSMAVALAPHITVNGIALGAVLPPADQPDEFGDLDSVPAARWANLDEVMQTVLFFLDGPSYITGEIVHLDGGRHLV
jgi:NAD(P)-dependent dehydrogenase (short-subunit alcohol dehydrogenase family)